MTPLRDPDQFFLTLFLEGLSDPTGDEASSGTRFSKDLDYDLSSEHINNPKTQVFVTEMDRKTCLCVFTVRAKIFF